MIPPRTPADVARIVEERIQESTTLEFKSQLPEPSKNFDLAKAIAALSNTAGGCIIYGIAEDDDSRASKTTPFHLAGCTERIALVAQTLDEPVSPREIYTVEQSEGIGYAIVDLEFSDRAPHFLDGTVFGRTPKTITTLSRRQVGELFSRSRGFVDEFQLHQAKPGRLLVQGRNDDGGSWISFRNVGETEIFDVDWLDREDSGLIITVIAGWPFPVPTLHPGQEIVQHVQYALGRGPFTVKTTWCDSQGEVNSDDWRVTF
ncbi:MAG: ATP-binding protein [Planctomycetes bacterium]|nr:ATP-binding protein [Planctomycetota bacterium]